MASEYLNKKRLVLNAIVMELLNVSAATFITFLATEPLFHHLNKSKY